MKKSVTLYNIYPLWFILLAPEHILLSLPIHFLIDCLVLLAGMALFKIADKKECFRYGIWRAFGFGRLADCFGVMYMAVVTGECHLDGVEWFVTVPGVVIAAVSIFLLHYFFTFRWEDRGQRLKMALLFAVATAPYAFLFPIYA